MIGFVLVILHESFDLCYAMLGFGLMWYEAFDPCRIDVLSRALFN